MITCKWYNRNLNTGNQAYSKSLPGFDWLELELDQTLVNKNAHCFLL